jgi:hypothetical protein
MLQHYFQVNTQATLTRLGHLATPVLACNAVSWLLTFAYIVVYKNSTNKAFVTSCLSGGTVFKSVIILILFLRGSLMKIEETTDANNVSQESFERYNERFQSWIVIELVTLLL